jgi:hypothetical protein
MPLTKGTALAVPHKDTVMRALAPEVRLLDMPDEIGHLSLHVRTLGTGAHKEILRESLENVPQGLKPSPIAHFTARLKPCPSFSVPSSGEFFRNLFSDL